MSSLPLLLRRMLGGYLTVAAVFASAFTIAAAPATAADKLQKLTLSGPFAAVSFPLIHMVDSGALKDVAPTLLALLGVPPPPQMTGRNLVTLH